MEVVPNIPSSLFTTFNDVTYYDEPHKYYVNGEQLTSVTTLLHNYAEEFDGDYWGEKKGNQFGVDSEEVKYGWKFINERATFKGSAIHDYIENLFLNKVFPYPEQQMIDHFGYDAVREEYDRSKAQADLFYDLVKNVLVPIRTEMVVWDKEFMIGGMVDLLFYNKKSKMFEIWDHKTNKEFITVSNRFLNPPLQHLTDSHQDIYSLQLSAYKYIIEKYCNIKLGTSHLVWYGNKTEGYQIIKADDRLEEVKKIFMLHKLNIN